MEEYKIAIRNQDGEVIDYTIVDYDDYALYKDLRFCMHYIKTSSTNLRYAQTSIDKKPTYLHQLIMGKAPDRMVIDHIDNNGLNNKRSNLRLVTYSQNNQNKKKIQNTSSQYIGVHWHKNNKRWQVNSANQFLGYFEDELDAAKTYDTFVLLKFGVGAKTNNLVTWDEVNGMTIDDFIKKNRYLPKNIRKDGNRYYVKVMYKAQTWNSSHTTLEEAIAQLNAFKKEIASVKSRKVLENEMQLNELGNALIPIRNTNEEIIEYAQVSPRDYYNVMRHKWRKVGPYYMTNIDNKVITLHRFLVAGGLIHHKDKNPNNNTRENLVATSHTTNNHNKSKNADSTSKYYGVSYVAKVEKWQACVQKEKKCYLGLYDTEIEAAIAYNIFCQNLYGNDANLNEINSDIFNLHKDNITEKMKRIGEKTSKYRGVSWVKATKRWEAVVYKDRKRFKIGEFNDEKEAAMKYNLKAKELYGCSFKRFNVID